MNNRASSQTQQSNPGLKRALSGLDIYAIGFGSMVGFAWVVLTGDWLVSAGALGAILALGAGGIIIAVIGLLYGELTAAMPGAGGAHNFLLRGLGRRWSFIGSWGMIGGYISIVCFEAVALPRTVDYIFPVLTEGEPLWTIFDSEVHLPWALVGAAAALIITIINYVGVKFAGVTQTWVVLFLIVIGLIFCVGGVSAGASENLTPLFTDATGFFSVLITAPFLYLGFDVIAQASEETRLPARKLGRAMSISVLLAAIWHMIIAGVTAYALPRDEIAGANLAVADAMGAVFNSQLAANVLIAGGIAGILTTWIALLLGASRLLYALGKSGMLPGWFGKLHPKYRTPSNAIMFIGGLSMLTPFLGEGALSWFVDSGSLSIVITYLLVAIVFVKLRRTEPELARPYLAGGRRFGVPVGVLGIALAIGFMILYIPGMPAAVHPVSYLMFVIWWIIGLVALTRVRSAAPAKLVETDEAL